MSDIYTGLISITSSGALDVGIPLRVYDFCTSTTAAAGSAVLWHADAVGTTLSTLTVCAVKAGDFISSNGLRFPNGLYCFVAGTSATISYYREF